jgi:hypothetical protein
MVVRQASLLRKSLLMNKVMTITPLIDADIFLYEIGFAVEAGWRKDGKEGQPPFDYVIRMLEGSIANMCAMVDATSPPVLYLTGKGNFRFDIAKRTPYKVRLGNKPFHYANLKAYIKGMYDYRESSGMEADDLMSIDQTANPDNTIICSRDKDLKSVPGWHYGWECGNQPSFGPMLVDEVGKIWLNDKRELKGYGGLFFYSQCLTGDTVDSIPGLGGRTGAVRAHTILGGCDGLLEAFSRVQNAYRDRYGDKGNDELLEQGRLLHMTRRLHLDGSPVLWELPDGN